MKKLLIGIPATIFAYLCFSFASLFVTYLGQHSVSIIQILFLQNAAGLLLLLGYAGKKGFSYIKTSHLSLHLVRDLSGLLSYFTYYWAIYKINLVDATVLAYTTPFIVPIFWKLWMKIDNEKAIWWSVIIGFIGIAFILKPSSHIIVWNSFWGLLSAALSSISLISINRLHQKKEPSSKILFYFFFVGTLALLPFVLPLWHTPSLVEWALLLGVGLSITLGQLSLTFAFRHGTASFLSPLCYFMIIFTMLLSWVFFSKTPQTSSLIGTSFIIIGGFLSVLLRHPKHIFTPNSRKWWQFWKKRSI